MDASDTIAIAAVLVSAAALAYTWNQDHRSRTRALADTVRLGSAKMLAKLSRWQELATWFYFESGPVLVEAAGRLASGDSKEKVRDWTWKTLPKVRTELLRKINDENLETVSPELCSYDIETLTNFMKLVAEMKAEERSRFEYFMERTQQLILNMQEDSAAFIGNKLREQAGRDRQRLTDQLEGSSSELRSYLALLISSPDKAILKKKVGLGASAQRLSSGSAEDPAGPP